MKNKISVILVISVVGLFYTLSCHKIETYPVTPQIEFLKFDKSDSSISFTFIDGDGNIGMEQQDSFIAYNGDTIKHNLFTILYEKIDSVYEEVIFPDSLGFNYRIPNIQPEGINKTLKGEINFKFLFQPYVIDTFKFEFYIYDNTLNKSNVETTPPLTFNE